MDRRKTVEAFRERLSEVIERSGLSRMAFSARVGLDRSTLSQLLSPGNDYGLCRSFSATRICAQCVANGHQKHLTLTIRNDWL